MDNENFTQENYPFFIDSKKKFTFSMVKTLKHGK